MRETTCCSTLWPPAADREMFLRHCADGLSVLGTLILANSLTLNERRGVIDALLGDEIVGMGALAP